MGGIGGARIHEDGRTVKPSFVPEILKDRSVLLVMVLELFASGLPAGVHVPAQLGLPNPTMEYVIPLGVVPGGFVIGIHARWTFESLDLDIELASIQTSLDCVVIETQADSAVGDGNVRTTFMWVGTEPWVIVNDKLF